MNPDKLLHRKRVKHYNDPGHYHELTFSCFQRRPLLTNHQWRCLLSESIDRAIQRHRYALNAFVFMPEHVHLLVVPQPEASGIDELLKAIKRPYSFRIKRLLEELNSPLLKTLEVQQRPGVRSFRYWQEGPGYDRNLERAETVLAAIDYFHLNPVKRGLVKRAIDWQWSSARWYEGLPYHENVRVPNLEKLSADFLSTAAR
jgi:putative transposase